MTFTLEVETHAFQLKMMIPELLVMCIKTSSLLRKQDAGDKNCVIELLPLDALIKCINKMFSQQKKCANCVAEHTELHFKRLFLLQ